MKNLIEQTQTGEILNKFQNPAKEQSIIMAITQDEGAINKLIQEGLEPKHFFTLTYKRRFEKYVDMAMEGDKKITYQDLLIGDEDDDEILYKMNTDIDVSNYLQDTKDIIDLYDKRELCGAILNAQAKLADDKISNNEVVDYISSNLENNTKSDIKTNLDHSLDDYYNVKVENNGIQTGFHSLDNAGLTFNNGQMIAIGADTGAGKTTFLTNLIANQIKVANKVLFFSLEQPAKEIIYKLLTIITGYSEKEIAEGKADREKVEKELAYINSKVLVIEKADITITEIRTRAKLLCRKDKYNLIAVDYWQQVQGGGTDERRIRLASIADSLNAMAQKLNLPVIVLGQVDKNSSRLTNLDRNAFSESKQLSNNAYYTIMLQKNKEAKRVEAEFVKSRNPKFTGYKLPLYINTKNERLALEADLLF
jgi:replicative DNA helicase